MVVLSERELQADMERAAEGDGVSRRINNRNKGIPLRITPVEIAPVIWLEDRAGDGEEEIRVSDREITPASLTREGEDLQPQQSFGPAKPRQEDIKRWRQLWNSNDSGSSVGEEGIGLQNEEERTDATRERKSFNFKEALKTFFSFCVVGLLLLYAKVRKDLIKGLKGEESNSN